MSELACYNIKMPHSSLLWMLEGLKKFEEALLDVPSYGRPLGEAIL